ncbi:MAG TPA: tetratricopeptide repeat protein [Kofleriaceae bacterium]|nr:tetratricopeptide repeat protein [Kofleriaceae bacterium]
MAKPTAQVETKPSIDADAVLSIEDLRSPIRTEQEQILVDLIANTADSEVDEKTDYYFRLGELYAKQHRFWRMKSVELATATDATRKKQSAQAADQAKTYLLKAVKTFKGLTDNDAFRNYPKLDTALFYYAYTLQGGKYMKEARQVYDKLLKNYPSSKFVPEAHLAFGDYYYEAGQLADAEARYKQVLKFPKSTVYAYALYKLGWIHLQLSRPQEATEAFYQVVAATRGDARQASLNHAAKTDFARAYAGIGKAEHAFDAFQKLDKSAAVELAELLADISRDKGDSNRAVTAYRDLLLRAPGDARACRWQYRIAHATLSIPGATNAVKVKEVEALVHSYTSQKQPDAECRANAAAMSAELAAAYHAEWSKTQNVETLGYAEQLYAMHVAAFPDAAAQRETYAEVLWSRADHESTAKVRAERWQRTADVFATIHTQEAARATALAWMNALDITTPADTKVVIGKPPRSRPRALPLKGLEAKLVAAVTAYTQQSPDADEDLAQMRLATATILRRNRHFDEAAAMLDEFLEHHPDHALAELAANLMLDSLVKAARLDDALQVADAIATDRAFVEGKQELQRNIQLLRLLH